MDLVNAAQPRLSPPSLPVEGIHRVLSSWSGGGKLLQALAAASGDPESGRRWSEADLERRAFRVLFEILKPDAARLPRRASQWMDALPAVTASTRVSRPGPFSGASWTETWRRAGWPPTAIWGKIRHRADDSVLVSSLRWTLETLLRVAEGASWTWPTALDPVADQLAAARAVLAREPLASAPAVPPSRVEILAMRRDGPPWSVVADVATHLHLLVGSAEALAFQLLAPDPDLRPLLFHLGTLGAVIVALERAGCRLTSVRPISGRATGPAYAVEGYGATWDLWFEAGGAWRHYGVREPYRIATAGMPMSYQPLGADIMLIARERRALVIECKYPVSSGPEYIARAGFLQAVTYAVEARELASDVAALVVGPEELTGAGTAITAAGRVSFAPPSALPSVVHAFLTGGDSAHLPDPAVEVTPV